MLLVKYNQEMETYPTVRKGIAEGKNTYSGGRFRALEM